MTVITGAAAIKMADAIDEAIGHPPMEEDAFGDQMAALCEGEPISGILVGWQDAPSDYLGIFMLGDMVDHPMPTTMLDRIARLARGH